MALEDKRPPEMEGGGRDGKKESILWAPCAQRGPEASQKSFHRRGGLHELGGEKKRLKGLNFLRGKDVRGDNWGKRKKLHGGECTGKLPHKDPHKTH